MMLARYFDDFREEFGPPSNTTPVTEADISAFEGKLPPVIFDYWREFGFSTYRDGLVQMVNPADWKVALDGWLEGTELAEKDSYHVLWISAFGELFVWGEKTGYDFAVRPYLGTINLQKKNYEKALAKGIDSQNYWMESFAFKPSLHPEIGVDINDEDGKPLFKQAKKKLGPLKLNEIYGFAPAIQAGGEWRVENLKKIDGPVHFDILRQIKTPVVLTFKQLSRMIYGDAGLDVINAELDKI